MFNVQEKMTPQEYAIYEEWYEMPNNERTQEKYDLLPDIVRVQIYYDDLWEDTNNVIDYYEDKIKPKPKKEPCKDGRRNNGGHSTKGKAGAKKGNTNALKTFENFDIEKHFGVPKNTHMGIYLQEELSGVAWLLLERHRGISDPATQKVLDIETTAHNRNLRHIEKTHGIKRTRYRNQRGTRNEYYNHYNKYCRK